MAFVFVDPEQANCMFTRSIRLPLLAMIGCIALSACDQSQSPPAYAPEEAAPVDASEQAPVAAEPAMDPAAQTGPATLTEIDEAARSRQFPASGMCSFDKIDGAPIAAALPSRLQDVANFTVSGWVVDRTTMTRPQAVLRLQEVNGGRAWEIGVGAGTTRGDVGRYLKAENLRDAGFEVQTDLSPLPPGEYALMLHHQAGDRRVVCDKGARIIVGG